METKEEFIESTTEDKDYANELGLVTFFKDYGYANPDDFNKEELEALEQLSNVSKTRYASSSGDVYLFFLYSPPIFIVHLQQIINPPEHSRLGGFVVNRK